MSDDACSGDLIKRVSAFEIVTKESLEAIKCQINQLKDAYNKVYKEYGCTFAKIKCL